MTFKKDGYIVVKGLYKPYGKLYKYTLKNKIHGILNDHQAPGSPSFYNDKEMVKLHKKLLSKIEKYTGLKLFKTYCYYRTYKKGDILRIHQDRPACEISVTLNLGRKDKYSWPIWIVNYNEIPEMVILHPGDALIYMGCDVQHWRPKNKYSDDYSQVFLHYVDKNGPNAWAKNDLYRVKPNQN